MEANAVSNYSRIARAIEYIQQHFREQPSLDTVAAHVHLSPFHFQKLFSEWAGVSPKKFIQYLSIGHAKNMLKEKQVTLFDAALESGLSGTGRLHDLFVSIEGMTPGEFKNRGENLSINYSYEDTPFGPVLIASTSKGICYMAFSEDEPDTLLHLKNIFPNAGYINISDAHQQMALSIFTKNNGPAKAIKLHLKGTPFQIKVWEALLKIAPAQLSSYSSIADSLMNPKASRAVGSAVGGNPVAYIIPCHRVIRSTGEFGEYHWGITRKCAMIGWEAANAYGKGD
jgi:AraC family transcriptional regulator of adaptative response/methylated-DNA-[protein]-cysteine methyltransferase